MKHTSKIPMKKDALQLMLFQEEKLLCIKLFVLFSGDLKIAHMKCIQYVHEGISSFNAPLLVF